VLSFSDPEYLRSETAESHAESAYIDGNHKLNYNNVSNLQTRSVNKKQQNPILTTDH